MKTWLRSLIQARSASHSSRMVFTKCTRPIVRLPRTGYCHINMSQHRLPLQHTTQITARCHVRHEMLTFHLNSVCWNKDSVYTGGYTEGKRYSICCCYHFVFHYLVFACRFRYTYMYTLSAFTYSCVQTKSSDLRVEWNVTPDRFIILWIYIYISLCICACHGPLSKPRYTPLIAGNSTKQSRKLNISYQPFLWKATFIGVVGDSLVSLWWGPAHMCQVATKSTGESWNPSSKDRSCKTSCLLKVSTGVKHERIRK